MTSDEHDATSTDYQLEDPALRALIAPTVDQVAQDLFRARMVELRGLAGLSQAALAERLAEQGVRLDSSSITKIEKGYRSIRLGEAVAIAAALRVSLAGMLSQPLTIEQQVEQARSQLESAEAAAGLAVAEWRAAEARLSELISRAGQASSEDDGES